MPRSSSARSYTPMWVVARSSITQSRVGERPARAGQLADPLGQQPRLGLAPDGHVRGAEASPNGAGVVASGGKRSCQRLGSRSVHQQLHARAPPAAAGRGRPGARPARRTSSPHRPSKVMSTASSTSPRLRKFTVIRSARPPRARPRQVAAEHAHVGVAEAVDRLALVADAEQVVALQQLQQLVLQRVGVLELVDHHVREALAVLLAHARVARPAGRAPPAPGRRSPGPSARA